MSRFERFTPPLSPDEKHPETENFPVEEMQKNAPRTPEQEKFERGAQDLQEKFKRSTIKNLLQSTALFALSLTALDCASVGKNIRPMQEKFAKDAVVSKLDGYDTNIIFDPKRGELSLERMDETITFRRIGDFGVHSSPKDGTGPTLELMDDHLADMKFGGTNYEISDPQAFEQFLMSESQNIIQEWNAQGGQAPIEFKNIREREWLELALTIVDKNLRYNHPSLESTSAGQQENARMSAEPLDSMLMSSHKGVCRQYAAAVEKVADLLKKMSGSKYLENVAVGQLGSDLLNHGYNVALEQIDKEVNVYFLDTTGAEKDNFRLSDKEALTPKGLKYSSVAEFFRQERVGMRMSEEEILELYKNMAQLEAGDTQKEQVWLGQAAQSAELLKRPEEAVAFDQKILDRYSDLHKQNLDRRARGEKPVESYPIAESLRRILAQKSVEQKTDEMRELLLDERFWNSPFPHTSDAEQTLLRGYRVHFVEEYVKHMAAAGDHEAITEMVKTTPLPPDHAVATKIMNAFLEQGKFEEGVGILWRYGATLDNKIVFRHAQTLSDLTSLFRQRLDREMHFDPMKNRFDIADATHQIMETLAHVTVTMDERGKNSDNPAYKKFGEEARAYQKTAWENLWNITQSTDAGDGEALFAFLESSQDALKIMIQEKTMDVTKLKEDIHKTLQTKNIRRADIENLLLTLGN